MVNINSHGQPDVTLMIWGAVWVGGRSKIVIMERDSTSTGKGYTSWSYIQALEIGLLPDYPPGTFFQQDNAKIHTSKVTKAWFESHGIWVIDWPAHSPDMNPIEHVWKALKAEVHRRHPDLHLLKNNAADIAKLKA